MSRASRLPLIQKLAAARDSAVLCYFTSTREGIDVPMAMDAPRLVYDHLQLLTDRPKRLDLLLHSNGGDGVVPWRLVTLLREYCDFLSVLVPHRAFSAATLTALGADEIVMLPLAMLGPVDPTTANEFNPPRPDGQRVGISVEDVAAYVTLVKEDVGITHEDELVQAFNILAQQIHPLALGNVKRTTQQSRMMARKLLQLHMEKVEEEHRIDKIIESLTSRLFYHGHPINRTEAKKDLDLKVVSNDANETLIWELYLEFERDMELQTPFRPVEIYLKMVAAAPAVAAPAVPGGALPGRRVKPADGYIAYIESEKLTHRLVFEHEIVGQVDPNTGITSTQLLTLRTNWEVEP